jgi:hypothetical protein
MRQHLTPDLIRNRLKFCNKMLPDMNSTRPWLYNHKIIFFSDESHIRLTPEKATGLYHWSYRPGPPVEERKNSADYITVSGIYGYSYKPPLITLEHPALGTRGNQLLNSDGTPRMKNSSVTGEVYIEKVLIPFKLWAATGFMASFSSRRRPRQTHWLLFYARW